MLLPPIGDRWIGMTYALKRDLLEVCNCKALRPCWIGEDPDNGVCKRVNAYRIDLLRAFRGKLGAPLAHLALQAAFR